MTLRYCAAALLSLFMSASADAAVKMDVVSYTGVSPLTGGAANINEIKPLWSFKLILDPSVTVQSASVAGYDPIFVRLSNSECYRLTVNSHSDGSKPDTSAVSVPCVELTHSDKMPGRSSNLEDYDVMAKYVRGKGKYLIYRKYNKQTIPIGELDGKPIAIGSLSDIHKNNAITVSLVQKRNGDTYVSCYDITSTSTSR